MPPEGDATAYSGQRPADAGVEPRTALPEATSHAAWRLPSAAPEAEDDTCLRIGVAPRGDRLARPRLWGGA